MAETRSMNPVVKYLLFAIAFLLQVALVAGIAIFVYIKFAAIREEKAATAQGHQIKASVKFDEFKFPSSEGGLVSFKMEIDLSDEDMKEEFGRQLSYIRDGVPRLFMKMSIDQIKEAYVDHKLHDRAQEWLELNVVKLMPHKKTWAFGESKTYAVVRVNIYDLSAMKLE